MSSSITGKTRATSPKGTVDNPYLFGAKQHELEKFLLLGLWVAGKNAAAQQPKLDGFCRSVDQTLPHHKGGPLSRLRAFRRKAGDEFQRSLVDTLLREHKVGQYRLINAAIDYLTADRLPDLQRVTREQLVEVPKIGLKTASFFILYTQPGAEIACLDTHILRYLREDLGYNTPPSTPTGLLYLELEQVWLDHCRKLGKTSSDLDFEVWSRYRRGS